MLAGPRGQRLLISSKLAMGARAPGQNRACLDDLAAAAEDLLVLNRQLNHLLQQLGVGNDLALAEVHEPLVKAIALCPPAVLI